MGGNVPLGYEPDGRTLRINPDEAQAVRKIYDLYDDLDTMNMVREAAARLNLRSKARCTPDGKQQGGNRMSRGQLHHLLTNPIHAEHIRHKGKVFEGQHAAIIDPARWDELQKKLSGGAAKARRSKQHRNPSPLAGKVVDETGERLTPSHTKKGDKRYRYYISQKLVTGVTRADGKQRTWRIPAGQLESAIANAVQKQIMQFSETANAQQFPGTETPVPDEKEALDVVERVRVAPGQLTVDLKAGDLQKLIGAKFGAKLNCDHDDLTLDLPFTGRRRGVEMKLVIGNDAAEVDETLLANIIRANQWYQRLKEGQSFESIAAEAGTSKRRVQQVMDLAFLAPDIVRDITNGTQPMGLTSDWCLRHDLPANWQAQRQRIATLGNPRFAYRGNRLSRRMGCPRQQTRRTGVCPDQRPPQPTETTQLIGRASGITGFVKILGCAGSAEPTGLVWCDTTEKSIRTMPDYTGLCRMKCVQALRNGVLSGSGHNHAGAVVTRPRNGLATVIWPIPALAGREWPESRIETALFPEPFRGS